MVDLSVPIELVSKFMRHADTHVTETIYASVRQEHVGDRILASIDPRYARQTLRVRKTPIVPTLKRIPEPRQIEVRHEVDGISRTLSEWAQVTRIPKTTLHYRVVTKGMTMTEAIELGQAKYRKRPRRPSGPGSTSGGPSPGDCETGVKERADGGGPSGLSAPSPLPGPPQIPVENSVDPVRPVRFERTTRGFEGHCSIQLSYGRAAQSATTLGVRRPAASPLRTGRS
jgi:hypothetical protein